MRRRRRRPPNTTPAIGGAQEGTATALRAALIINREDMVASCLREVEGSLSESATGVSETAASVVMGAVRASSAGGARRGASIASEGSPAAAAAEVVTVASSPSSVTRRSGRSVTARGPTSTSSPKCGTGVSSGGGGGAEGGGTTVRPFRRYEGVVPEHSAQLTGPEGLEEARGESHEGEGIINLPPRLRGGVALAVKTMTVRCSTMGPDAGWAASHEKAMEEGTRARDQWLWGGGISDVSL